MGCGASQSARGAGHGADPLQSPAQRNIVGRKRDVEGGAYATQVRGEADEWEEPEHAVYDPNAELNASYRSSSSRSALAET